MRDMVKINIFSCRLTIWFEVLNTKLSDLLYFVHIELVPTRILCIQLSTHKILSANNELQIAINCTSEDFSHILKYMHHTLNIQTHCLRKNGVL